jgi:beta-glucanase (GH16 family)
LTGGIITGAEVHSTDTMISGHLSMTSRVSPVHGTCQAMFTYIDEGGYPMAGDEQDIEMLGQTLDEGIVLTNWNPKYVFVLPNNCLWRRLSSPSPVPASSSYHSQSEGTVVPFPSPPTTAFHNYTIFWPPADASPRQTSYYFDGQLLNTMDQYVSVNPSRAYLNNWSNGQASFTQGPPTDDAVLEVAHLAWYYSTAQVPGLPNGCTMQQACRV